ncbi:MAG: hypothetical protein KF831_17340 [Acidobacteria bacterium]|nr:hypothetical protein [Acidobacteriota bacterium]
MNNLSCHVFRYSDRRVVFLTLLAILFISACQRAQLAVENRQPLIADTATNTNAPPDTVVSSPVQSNELWRGNVSNSEFIWTETDLIIVSKSGNKTGIFASEAQRRFNEMQFASNEACTVRISYTLLSVAAGILSFRESLVGFCEGSTSVEKSESTYARQIRLDGPDGEGEIELQSPADLRSFFAESDIVRGIIQNSEFRSTLKANGISERPLTIAGLMKLQNRLDANGIADSGQRITEESWKAFSFESLNNDYIGVRLELRSSAGASNNHSIVISLPVPTNLQSSLKNAHNQSEGVLYDDLHRLVGERTTIIELKTHN